jgi:hypothetical protein
MHRPVAPSSPSEFDELMRLAGLLSADERREWARRRGAMLLDALARREAVDVVPVPRAPRLRSFARAAA